MATVTTGIILFFASTVQGAVGFGMALLAVPLLVGNGLELQCAVPLVLAGSFLNASFGAIRLRADIPWRDVAIALAVRTVGLGLGVSILVRLSYLEPARIRGVLGLIVLLAVFLQAFGREFSQSFIRNARIPLFFLSGLSHGAVGMGGPFMMLWLLATDWTSDRIRAFLFACYAISLPVAIALCIASVGTDASHAVAVGLGFFPIALFGAYLGGKLGRKVCRNRLRLVVFLSLGLVGGGAVWGGF